MNKRQTTAAVLFLIGFLLVVGTFGKYEFNGFISPAEFLGKTVIGIALMAAAVPVSGDIPTGKKKNRP